MKSLELGFTNYQELFKSCKTYLLSLVSFFFNPTLKRELDMYSCSSKYCSIHSTVSNKKFELEIQQKLSKFNVSSIHMGLEKMNLNIISYKDYLLKYWTFENTTEVRGFGCLDGGL